MASVGRARTSQLLLRQFVLQPPAPSLQNVWGLRYIDDLILRDRDADNNTGTGNYGKTGSGLEERLYALQDPNWNVVAIADTSGVIQEHYRYTAYGKPTFLTSAFAVRDPNVSSYSWDVLYTGRHYDAGTSLYDYRARIYHSLLGRFITNDPIGYEAGDENLYRYVHNSPMNLVDPGGWENEPIGLSGEEVNSFKFHKCDTSCRLGRVPDLRRLGGLIECDNQGHLVARIYSKHDECRLAECVQVHEWHHLLQFQYICPNICDCALTKEWHLVPQISGKCHDIVECGARVPELECIYDLLREHKKTNNLKCISKTLKLLRRTETDWIIFHCNSYGIDFPIMPEDILRRDNVKPK